MANRIDWRRARPRRETEDAIGPAVQLKDGTRTRRLPKNDLQRRADEAMRQWTRQSPQAAALLGKGGAS